MNARMVIVGCCAIVLFSRAVPADDALLLTVSTSGYVNRPADEANPVLRESDAVQLAVQCNVPFSMEIRSRRRTVSIKGMLAKNENGSLSFVDFSYGVEDRRRSGSRRRQISTDVSLEVGADRLMIGSFDSQASKDRNGVSKALKSHQSVFVSVARVGRLPMD